MKSIGCRDFFGIALGSCIALWSGTALAQQVQWRMATSWPASLPLLHEAATDFAETVKRASNGRLTISIDDPSKHQKPLGILDLVKSGEYDIGHTTAQYYAKAMPAIDVFTAAPFGLTAVENHMWMEQGGGLELFEKLMAPHNIVPMIAGNTNVQMGGWFSKEIKTVEDLKDLRIRISGAPALVLERFGAKTVGVPLGRIVEAFEKKEIDAADIVGPAIDKALAVAKHAPYYYGPWHEPDVALHAFVNKVKYDALPADLKEIVRIAARSAALRSIARAQYQNAGAMADLVAQGTQVRKFPPEVMDALRKATAEVLADAAKHGPEVKVVIDSFGEVRRNAVTYTAVADKEIYDERRP